MKEQERARLIERAIRLTWASAESHLRLVHERRPRNESADFHKKAIREYLEILTILSKLY